MRKVYSYKGIPWSYQPASTDRVWLGKEVPEIVILSGNHQTVWTYEPVEPIVFDYSAFGDVDKIDVKVAVGINHERFDIDGPNGNVHGLDYEIDEANNRVTIWSDYALDDGDYSNSGYLMGYYEADPEIRLWKNGRIIAYATANLVIKNSWQVLSTEYLGPGACTNPGLSLRLSRMFAVGLGYSDFDNIRNTWTFGVSEDQQYYYTTRTNYATYFGDYPSIEIWNGTATGTIPYATPNSDYGWMYYNNPIPDPYMRPFPGLLAWRELIVMSEEFKNSKPRQYGPYPTTK